MHAPITVNDRTCPWPNVPVIAICLDGCEPDYLEVAIKAGLMPTLKRNIELITFTGGIPVGKMFAAKAVCKRQVLELGGNDPLIISSDLSDGDLVKAAGLAVAGATRNSGQRCTAVKRILAQESVADRLFPLVLDRAKRLRFGDPMDPATELGTVIHAKSAALVEKRVYLAEAQGAKVLYDPGRKGALLPPIVVDHVSHESELVMEETLGPVIPIMRVSDDDAETMRISNAAAYGLPRTLIGAGARFTGWVRAWAGGPRQRGRRARPRQCQDGAGWRGRCAHPVRPGFGGRFPERVRPAVLQRPPRPRPAR